ncbi:unnamed protein product, partial [Mesorhabditis belari]|uniref:Uncharacterized protein n=1 Tax=Mesorhabditis belari TaxID=2138241 RepID=A0AAF3ETX7_9BILA
MARLLNEAFPNQVLAVLEGGYFPDCYSESAYMFTRGLQGLDIPKVHHAERVNGSMTEVIWNNIVHHAPRWKCLQESLEKLQTQQRKLGLEEYASDNSLYLGHEVKQFWNKVVSAGICRTREWFPPLNAELAKLCSDKIDEVRQSYEYSKEIMAPTEDQLLKQLVWDGKAKLECHTKSLPSLEFWTEEYLSFKESRKNHMMVCDWDLVREKGLQLFDSI